MIRVYFDWNVVSNLKRNDQLKAVIDKHKEYLQFPFSHTHFKDLMKSYSPTNKSFFQDLEMLEQLSIKHHFNWDDERVVGHFVKPKDYFEGMNSYEQPDKTAMEEAIESIDKLSEEYGIKNFSALFNSILAMQLDHIDEQQKSNNLFKTIIPSLTSAKPNILKDAISFMSNLTTNNTFYKGFRKEIGTQGLKLEDNAGNWSPEDVFNNIDEYFKKNNINQTFSEFVESSFKGNTPKNPLTVFSMSYLLLDLIGYKSDKLPKPTDNMANITNDAEHAFYGAHCDYFVTNDKKLLTKAKVLYHEYNINTQVLSPEEFISVIDNVVHKPVDEEKGFINDAFEILKKGTFVNDSPPGEEIEAGTYGIMLPIFYFNYFNCTIYKHYEEEGYVFITFRKIFKNRSNFIFYTEAERILRFCMNFFGYDPILMEQHIKEFVYDNTKEKIEWDFDYGLIIIEKDELGRPNLCYAIDVGKDSQE